MRVLIFCLVASGCTSVRPPSPPPEAVARAERLAVQAARLGEQENWPAAAHAWERAAEQFSLLNDPVGEAIALHNLAQAERELGQWSAAHGNLTHAARLNERTGQRKDWWLNQIALLQVESGRDQTNQLEERFSSLLRRTNEISSVSLRGLFLNELGLWQQRRGEWTQAEASFTEARSVLRRSGDQTSAATATANLAGLDEIRDLPVEALTLWREALTAFEGQADPFGIAVGLAGVGRSLTTLQRELPVAEEHLRRAARNFRTLGQRDRETDALHALAACLELQGKGAEAEAVRSEARGLKDGSR